MTIFQQFIVIYVISTTAIAGCAVLWRNWLEDHPSWKEWIHIHLKTIGRAFICGSCFTYWLTLVFVLVFNPLGALLALAMPSTQNFLLISYGIQWMSLGWGAVFLRFVYVLIQEAVSIFVHRFHGHDH